MPLQSFASNIAHRNMNSTLHNYFLQPHIELVAPRLIVAIRRGYFAKTGKLSCELSGHGIGKKAIIVKATAVIIEMNFDPLEGISLDTHGPAFLGYVVVDLVVAVVEISIYIQTVAETHVFIRPTLCRQDIHLRLFQNQSRQ